MRRRAGENADLRNIDDGVCNIRFGQLKPGRIDERRLPIADDYGRLKRKNA